MTSKIKSIQLPENNVPQSADELLKMRRVVEKYVSENILIPPLLKDELIFHSTEIIKKYPNYFRYIKLLAVIINNYVWLPVVAQIPFDKRILLLPKCMRNMGECNAEFDELGLLCELCGSCNIGNFTTKAEELGYHTIVSEGTPPVSMLLRSGNVSCVVGVACMESIERSFKLALDSAIPSIAIPLYNSDCKNSRVDESWINEVLNLQSTKNDITEINFEQIRKKVNTWFTSENLTKLFGEDNETVKIANTGLSVGGKRFRPIITVSTYLALKSDENISEGTLMKLAVAVECFHKASLVHDDIADNDSERYKQKTLHEKYDIPIAVNIGDLLIGYGYQMIAESGASSEQITKLLKTASDGHRNLCFGQGKELLWRNTNEILSVPEIINIFSNKTSPAFETALKFGAVLAGADNKLMNILTEYSKSLGIAYQIKDDLDDFKIENSANDINALSPSLITGILAEKMNKKVNSLILSLMKGNVQSSEILFELAKKEKAVEEATQMLKKYQQNAYDVIKNIKNISLKILLFRIVKKITT